MKILILGGNGMIGHKIYQELKDEFDDTWVLIRKKLSALKYKDIYDSKVIDEFDLTNVELLISKLNSINPDIIINAAGITIRRGINELASRSIMINSVLPNLLEEWTNGKIGKKIIHFSTDCVFSGQNGPYTEESFTDANDLYGKTKALGEIRGPNSLTLRGSMIGRELDNFTELFEWALSQKNQKVKGFTNVMYSGITTIRMGKYVKEIIKNYPQINGLYNVSSVPISKYKLIQLFNSEFDLHFDLEKADSYNSNKVLDPTIFFNEIKMKVPTWDELIVELKDDYIENMKFYKNKQS